MDLTPIEFMMREFKALKEIDGVRKIIGRYGISGKQQTMPIWVGCGINASYSRKYILLKYSTSRPISTDFRATIRPRKSTNLKTPLRHILNPDI